MLKHDVNYEQFHTKPASALQADSQNEAPGLCQRCCQPLLAGQDLIDESHYRTPKEVRTVHRRCAEERIG